MYLYGASGHAKVIIDILRANHEPIEALFDDNDMTTKDEANSFINQWQLLSNSIEDSIEILENSYQICQQTKEMDIFIGELHVFSFIMNKYGEHFIEQGLNISSKLVDMLNGPNKTITVECLTCLIQIVSGLGEKSGPFIPQLIEQINGAFQSQSPEIIVQVDSLLGSLFV